jgi:hypothetical protein
MRSCDILWQHKFRAFLLANAVPHLVMASIMEILVVGICLSLGFSIPPPPNVAEAKTVGAATEDAEPSQVKLVHEAHVVRHGGKQ